MDEVAKKIMRSHQSRLLRI